MNSQTLKTFFDEEYARDVENFKSGLKPPAALSAGDKITRALSILNIPSSGLSFAWTFRSKGIRYFEPDGSVLLTDTGKALTIGRRCAMYVRLPCSVPSLGLVAGDYLGVVGDVSTQSTNVSTVVYFLVVPRSEKIWAIVGVLDVVHERIDLSPDSIKRSMETALNRSIRLKENRALARQRNSMASSSSSALVSRVARKRVEKSEPAVVVAEPAVCKEVSSPSEFVNSGEVAVAASAVKAEEQNSDLYESEGETSGAVPAVQNVQEVQDSYVYSPNETYQYTDMFVQQPETGFESNNWFYESSPLFEESGQNMDVFGSPEEDYW